MSSPSEPPRITRRLALATAAATSLPIQAHAENPRPTRPVETNSGRMRGLRTYGVSYFLGVPYGADTRAHRFKPAPPPEPWRGVRECSALGPRALQMESSRRDAGAPPDTPFVRELLTASYQGKETGAESEDCLVLNVWTPEASHRTKRPVLFWMHGGGFNMGSGGDAQYGGAALARRGDVVVVTVNHRLNAFGYLYLGALHEDFAASGNVGQLDLIQALAWVRDNIAAFGGDPDNVTIFGESGGGSKVSMTLTMPAARGLFHKAIIQSGPALRAGSRDAAAAFAERMLAALGVAPTDIHRLGALDARAIMQAAMTARAAGSSEGALSPIVDGLSLPRHPFDPHAPETARGVPLLIGTCKDEATLFLAVDPLFPNGTAEQVRARFTQMLGDRGEAAFDVYRALRPSDAPAYWLTSMSTGNGTWMNSIRIAERQAAQSANVYMFRLDWHAPFLNGLLRAPHGIDVPLVFDTVDARNLQLGDGPEPRMLAALMSQAWINFARTGDPSQPALAWPAYDTQTRHTMLFDIESRIVSDVDRPAREFWAQER